MQEIAPGGFQIIWEALQRPLDLDNLECLAGDEDGEISVAEAENVQNVNCSGRSISSIVDLQDCPNLKYLNFNGNNVSTLTALTHLDLLLLDSMLFRV